MDHKPGAAPDSYAPGARSTLVRRPLRGRYDKAGVHAVLDAGLICHVGYVVDGRPVVTPTMYWREGGRVYWHGARDSRPIQAAQQGVCFTVSLTDGLVLARSAFKHSVNYRAVMAFGEARLVIDKERKLGALRGMIERLYPGRWASIRPPSPAELAAVSVVSLELRDVSAKVRDDPPLDSEDDLKLPVWAGVLPLALQAGEPVPCARLAAGVGFPAQLREWRPSLDVQEPFSRLER